MASGPPVLALAGRTAELPGEGGSGPWGWWGRARQYCSVWGILGAPFSPPPGPWLTSWSCHRLCSWRGSQGALSRLSPSEALCGVCECQGPPGNGQGRRGGIGTSVRVVGQRGGPRSSSLKQAEPSSSLSSASSHPSALSAAARPALCSPCLPPALAAPAWLPAPSALQCRVVRPPCRLCQVPGGWP